MNDTRIVNAIQARIDGRFDDPDLQSVGALHDRIGDIVEILSMRDRTPGNTTVEEFTEFMEADSLQGCRESDRIAEGLDAMGNFAGIEALGESIRKHGHTNQTDTIDITPVGCQTPEGNERVRQAQQEWDSVTHQLANTIKELMEDFAPDIRSAVNSSRAYAEAFHKIEALIGARERKQEAFLRAVAGRCAMPLNENLGDCVWCFQPASGPHKKAVRRVWSREWQSWMELCKEHGKAIEAENAREKEVS